MESLIDLIHQLKDYLNPKYLIDWMLGLLGIYVYFGLFFVIFAETGLAVGFFLPGDSLLVVSGLFAAAEKLNIWLVMLACFCGSVIGDNTGYWTGRVMGKTLFNNFVKYCRTESGYAALSDVTNKQQRDEMESFVLAETFKYFYLLFAPPDTLDFPNVIFNTEAHPIKRFKKP